MKYLLVHIWNHLTLKTYQGGQCRVCEKGFESTIVCDYCLVENVKTDWRQAPIWPTITAMTTPGCRLGRVVKVG